jgi:hypothetical protein
VSEARDPAVRASDADRDAVAARLRDAHAEGRLTPEEFDQRLDATFAARTLGDLAPLTADLPAPASAPARTGDEPVAGHPARREESGTGWRVVWGSWLTVTLVCIAVWGAVSVSDGELGFFWPIWVAGPWGALLLARTLRGRR